MIHGVKDQSVDEHFTVANASGVLIIGIDTTSFGVYVYNPSGTEVSSSVSGSFTELGNGNYKYTFTPDTNGIWYITVTHPTYFSSGKSDDIVVDSSDLTAIYDAVIRALGLINHNVYIDQPVYDDDTNLISGRVRIYSDAASVGTDSNVIETYLMTADGDGCGKFTYWQQVVTP